MLAVVVFSETIREEIRNKIGLLYKEEIAKLSAIPEHWYTMVVEGLIPDETRQKMNALPPDYFPLVSSLYVSNVPCRRSCLTLTTEKPVRLPLMITPDISGATMRTPYQGSRYSTYDIVLKEGDPRWSKLLEEITEWNRQVVEADNKCTEAVAKARTFLAEYRTLSPALKDWPALWELLPERVKARHREPTKRKDRAPRANVNLQELEVRVASKLLTDGKV